MRQPGFRGRRPFLLVLLLPLLAAAATTASTVSPGEAVEVAGTPGPPAGAAACRCCPSRSPRRSRCFRAPCRVRSCPLANCEREKCPTSVSPGLPSPSPSPSVQKRQVSLNWQLLTLQEAQALLRRRRPGRPGGWSLLRKRPPQRAPAGQAPGKNIRHSCARG
ncbi:latent-transforming growth factor beta-binding protein 4-like [Erinaceus europaeus]|uniref:Latent-transforming growth factor beta-binding protein 4-like n=1 Tax=Erinaceus europaeus TaxID=9365 RepID=A0ABM3WZC9_ERIEU|nr:latent-transforming growth factor beta-binding protein 4-like [Erinaceus europaeus]